MSLIHTCELCGANPFDYLTQLQRHADAVAAAPQHWLPWNYRKTLEGIEHVQTPTEQSHPDDRRLHQGCARHWRNGRKTNCLTSWWNWRKRIVASSAGSLRDSSWRARHQELAAATRQAIADATDFDERDINRNFSYDYEAYGEVKRNLSRLIDLGELRLAMELSLELMKQGSWQVEMSDEGLMTQDIEECLRVVLPAVKKSGQSPDEVVAWCAAMIKSDRVGFICDRDLGEHPQLLRMR